MQKPQILTRTASSHKRERENIFNFSQIGSSSLSSSSSNLSALQMRRCEFIFSGKWDFDRKFTERLPATVGCLTPYNAPQCAVCSAQQFVRIMRLWPFTLGSPISNHSDQVRFPTFLFRTSRTNQNLKEEWNFWKSESKIYHHYVWLLGEHGGWLVFLKTQRHRNNSLADHLSRWLIKA